MNCLVLLASLLHTVNFLGGEYKEIAGKVSSVNCEFGKGRNSGAYIHISIDGFDLWGVYGSKICEDDARALSGHDAKIVYMPDSGLIVDLWSASGVKISRYKSVEEFYVAFFLVMGIVNFLIFCFFYGKNGILRREK